MQPVAQAPAHRAVEDLVGAAAAGLHAVHRGVGALDEVGRASRRGSSTAIPIAAVTKMPADRRLERRGEPLGERGGLALVLELGQHGELVAAEARERLRDVELPPAGASATCISTSSPAAWPCVSLTARKRSRPSSSTATRRAQRPRERLLEALLEEQPVRQAGQRVVQRLVDEPLVQAARLGEVDDRDHQPLDRPSAPRRSGW